MDVHFTQHTKRTQATAVLEKFGGAKAYIEILEMIGRSRSITSIYRWNYPRERHGTGGLIPTSAWREILEAAAYAGITIEPELMDLRNFL